MKILVALHDYLPLHKGGSEIHAHQTARELARRGHDVTALFTERDTSAPEGTVRRGELDGVKTIEVVHQREYADVGETWVQEGSLAAFRALAAELSPDVVHFHHTAIWGSSTVPAARDAGARIVLTLHDYYPICDAATLLRSDGELCTDGLTGDCTDCLHRHPLLSARWGGSGGEEEDEREELYRRAARERFRKHAADLRAAHRIISPSHFLADLFARAGFFDRDRFVVLRAGYPGTVYPARTRDPARPLRVGYVGGIYFSKGLHLLVDAFAHLAGVDAELHVHGHLDWFPEYVAGLTRSAEGRPVHFHGAFDPPRLDAVLAELDVLVVPSVWYENMPITINEAHRNGIPVVATELGGMAEAIEDGVSGLTFPRGDAAALAARLRSLTEDAELYDRIARGRPPTLALETVVDRLEEIYAESS